MAPPARSNPFEAPPDPEEHALLYGQSAGFVDAVRPAAEVVRAVSEDAERIVRSRPQSILA